MPPKMTAIEFYKARATTIVNVPRPGHPKDPSGIAGVRKASEAQYFAKDAPVMLLSDACQFAEAYAAYIAEDDTGWAVEDHDQGT